MTSRKKAFRIQFIECTFGKRNLISDPFLMILASNICKQSAPLRLPCGGVNALDLCARRSKKSHERH
jgi:hypothetical protein